MKKLLLSLSMLVFVFGLTACGGDKETTKENNEANTENVDSSNNQVDDQKENASNTDDSSNNTDGLSGKTLEELVNDELFMETMAAMFSSFEEQGMEMSFSAKGDVLTMVCKSDMLDTSMQSALQQALETDAMISTMENSAGMFKAACINETLILKVVYQDGQGNEIASKEYTAP